MPIGTDLVLNEQPNPKAVLNDGVQLGQVVAETARRFNTPLALAHMDLEVEKETLLTYLGIPTDQIPIFQFQDMPQDNASAIIEAGFKRGLTPRLQAHIDAITYVSQKTNLVPVAMCIGPFSLTTKLLRDPITPIFMAGTGASACEDFEIARMEKIFSLAMQTVYLSIRAKIQAGAKAVCIAEPAANKVYLSPKQIEKGSDIFDRYVMNNHRIIRHLLADHGVDLVFHCCGELTSYMVQQFATLDPAILSLGSSRKLWEDASLVPKSTVLFGNLPSKRFYSDSLISADEVVVLAKNLMDRMQQTQHPFILGSECDVLSVPGCQQSIQNKIQAFMTI